MSEVEFTDNSAEILAMLEKASAAALEIVGGKVESWAKGLCAPKGPNGNPMRGAAELRNSGLVKAKKVGTTTITVTTANKKKATIKVKVVK